MTDEYNTGARGRVSYWMDRAQRTEAENARLRDELRQIKYHANAGHQDRPPWVRLGIISTKAEEALATPPPESEPPARDGDKRDSELEATRLARDELERLYAKALEDAARWRETAERWYGKAIERAGHTARQSAQCPRCAGRGYYRSSVTTIKDRCPACSGTGKAHPTPEQTKRPQHETAADEIVGIAYRLAARSGDEDAMARIVELSGVVAPDAQDAPEQTGPKWEPPSVLAEIWPDIEDEEPEQTGDALAMDCLEDMVKELEDRGHDEIRRSKAYSVLRRHLTASGVPYVPESVQRLPDQWRSWGLSSADACANELETSLAAAPAVPDDKYTPFLGPFVRLMNAELHANAGKGDRQGWLSMSSDQAMLEIYYHAAKLQKAVRDGEGALIREHSADVANMSMMILDLCVGLTDMEPAAAPTHGGSEHE